MLIRTTLYTVSVLIGVALVLLDHFWWGMILLTMSGYIPVTKKQLGTSLNPVHQIILLILIGLTIWLGHRGLIPEYVFPSILVLVSIYSVAREWRKLWVAAQPIDAVSAALEVGNGNNSGRDPKRT